MRTAALAIALLMSGAAIAQTYETDTTVDTGAQPDTDQSVDADVQTQPDMTTDTDTTAEPGMTTQTDTTTQSAPPTQTDQPTQTDTTTHTDMTTHTGTPSQTDPMATTTMDQTQTQTQMSTAMAPASEPIVQPGNDDPEHDARGIAVISDPAMVPSGWNGITGSAVGGPLVDPATGETMAAADASYPPCSADVTDNCLQAYERGRSS